MRAAEILQRALLPEIVGLRRRTHSSGAMSASGSGGEIGPFDDAINRSDGATSAR
jgi:hypothetical protein